MTAPWDAPEMAGVGGKSDVGSTDRAGSELRIAAFLVMGAPAPGGTCPESDQPDLLVIPAAGGAERLLTWAEFWAQHPAVDTDELSFMATTIEHDMAYEFRYRGVTYYVRAAPAS